MKYTQADFKKIQPMTHKFEEAGTQLAEHLSDMEYPKNTTLIYPDKAVCTEVNDTLIEKILMYGFSFIPNVTDLPKVFNEACTKIQKVFDLKKYKDPIGEAGDFWGGYAAPHWHRDQMNPPNRGIGILGSYQPVNSKGGNFQIHPWERQDTIYQIPFNKGDNLLVFVDDLHRGTRRFKIDSSKPACHNYLRGSFILY